MGLSGLPSCRELILGVTLESLQGNEALFRVDGDIGVFSNGVPDTRVPIEFQGETSLLLKCDGNAGFLCRRSRGMDPHLEMRRGKWGSS